MVVCADFVLDFCSEKMLKGWAEDKSNLKTPDELLDTYIQCYNDSIKNHVGKMHIGLHICRGIFSFARFGAPFNLTYRQFYGIPSLL